MGMGHFGLVPERPMRARVWGAGPRFGLAGLLVAWAAIAGTAEEAAVASRNAALQAQIASWVRQLNADRYETREAAMKSLVAAGGPAVGPIAQAVRSGSWEVTTRGVFVLQELALARESETADAAQAALEAFAAVPQTPLGRRAGEALAKLDQLGRQRALAAFQQLGAKITPEHQEPDLFHGYVRLLEIGPEWRGQEADLRRLKWLKDVQQVTLIGEQVTDSWLPHLQRMDGLVVLKVKRARVTDAGLANLKQMPSLRYLKLLYVPVGDPAAATLAECRNLLRLHLYGTNLTTAAAEQLAAALGAEIVDCRKGAFLGVRPTDPGPTWSILSVTPDSAAEKAGLRPGDVITRYGDHEVLDFKSLTKLIGQSTAGETVNIQIRREGKILTKQVTFGNWE